MKPLSSKGPIIQHGEDWNTPSISGETFSPFGPSIYIGNIIPNVFHELNDKIESVQHEQDRDLRGRLAGRVEIQRDIHDLVSPQVHEHIRKHIVNYTTQYGLGVEEYQIIDDGMWVNCAKANDFNPKHLHTGDFSYIIYTKNTIDYDDERNAKFDDNTSETNENIAGQLVLYYGEYQFLNCAQFSHRPQEGDIIIFPAFLQHSVYPFYCDGERWSVAGNYRFATYEELNPPQETD